MLTLFFSVTVFAKTNFFNARKRVSEPAIEKRGSWEVYPLDIWKEFTYVSQRPPFQITCPDNWRFAQRVPDAVTSDDPARAAFLKDTFKSIPGYVSPAIFIIFIPINEPLTIEKVLKATAKKPPDQIKFLKEPQVIEMAGRQCVYSTSQDSIDHTYTGLYEFIGDDNILIRVKIVCMLSEVEEIAADVTGTLASIKFTVMPDYLRKDTLKK